MTKDGKEYSPGGSRIYRHQASEHPYETPKPDYEAIQKLEAHIARYIPGEGSVYHELVSDALHIDVHMIYPTSSRNFITLVTTGMSDKPMNAPKEFDQYRYSELVMCLPPDWHLEEPQLKNEENYWPIRWMKILSRLPNDYDTWLWATHTVPNGNPPHPYAHNTKMCCLIVASPTLFGEDFLELDSSESKKIYFNSVIPIYKEEMDFKLDNSAGALFKLFEAAGVNELLDPQRKSVIKRGGLFGAFKP
jgi:hypothetical protein